MHDISLGMAVNMISAYERMRAKQSGEDVSDPEKQYRILKESEPEIEEQYAQGNIPEEKYRAFKKAMAEWEED